MPAEVTVAIIGAIALVLVAVVNKLGAKADQAQKALTVKASDEHTRYQEMCSLAEANKALAQERAADALAFRDERDDARADARASKDALRLCEDDRRRVVSDLLGLAMVVRDEVAREATETAYAMERAEQQERGQ